MKDKKIFEKYIKVFLEQNQKLNLVSSNDANLLWEKHIYDSLAIEKFFEKYNYNIENKKLLDIGTGGGFPSVPIAIAYPKLNVYALDSIRKKINAIDNIKEQLCINNLNTICERAEKLTEKYDLITCRAVAPLKIITEYSAKLLKKDGFFIAYKSIRAQEEIEEAKPILNKYRLHANDLIKYDLPLAENHVRNLIVISNKNGNVKFCKV